MTRPIVPGDLPLKHQTTLVYTEALLRRAVFAFWLRTVGIGFLVALALLACSLAFLLWRGDRSWFVGALGAFLVFGLGFAALVHRVHLHQSLAKFRAMATPQAELVLDETSFTMTSNLGSSTLHWPAVTEVWRYPTFWLLLFSKAQFVTLPLADVPSDAQALILNRVAAAGGKVVG